MTAPDFEAEVKRLGGLGRPGVVRIAVWDGDLVVIAPPGAVVFSGPQLLDEAERFRRILGVALGRARISGPGKQRSGR